MEDNKMELCFYAGVKQGVESVLESIKSLEEAWITVSAELIKNCYK